MHGCLKYCANQGRYFFTCSAARDQQCRFFCWAEDDHISTAVCLTNAKDIETLATGQDIPLYCECFFYSRKIQKFHQVSIDLVYSNSNQHLIYVY